MKVLTRMLPTEQRRMKISLITLAANFLIFFYGIYNGADLSDLGTGLSLVNSPIIAFIIGESIRPTGYKAPK